MYGKDTQFTDVVNLFKKRRWFHRNQMNNASFNDIENKLEYRKSGNYRSQENIGS